MTNDSIESVKRWAHQPDGRVHLLSEHRWHAACGLRLKSYETHYGYVKNNVDRPDLCAECRAILKQRASFPQPATETQHGAEAKSAMSRIRKLLALAESPNEAEAALATARANELLQKHNLSLHVAEDANQQKAEKRMTDSLGIRVLPHKYVLGQACCHMFDVECYATRRLLEPGTYLVFLGLPMNVETAVLTYAYLCAAVDALAQSRKQVGAIRGVGPLRDYKLGAAERICAMVHELKTKAEADPSIGALVRISRGVARRAYDAEMLGDRNRLYADASNRSAYELGYADGSQIDPHGARSSRMLTPGE